MRLIVLLILIGAAGAAGWFWLNRDRSADLAAAEARVERQKAALGMNTHLREHEIYTFQNIVLGGRNAEGEIDFRGQVAKSGRLTPAFGRLRGLCDTERERPECWELAYLEADGQVMALAPASAETASEETPAEEPETIAPAGETAGDATPSAEGETAPQTPAVQPASQPVTGPVAAESPAETPTETSAAQPVATQPAETPAPAAEGPEPLAPPATHQVARALINTRSGPGTENPVVTRLQSGAQLALLETVGGWGRFIVLDGDERGTEVWAALSILEPL